MTTDNVSGGFVDFHAKMKIGFIMTHYLHFRNFIDDASISLGVKLGVLLAVRQQLEHVQHEVSIPDVQLRS